MGFQVVPEAVQSFAALVSRGADGATKAVAYTTNHARIDKTLGGKCWDIVTGDHDAYVAAAKDALQKAHDILDSSQRELSRSAEYYRATDSDQAARLDATYPGSKAGGTPPAGTGGDFTDARDASAALKPPAGAGGSHLAEYGQGHLDEYDMNPGQKAFGTVLDLGSPSTVAVEAVKLIFGYDIFGEINNWVLGDWSSYRDCVGTWGALGEFCAALSANLHKGTTQVGVTWQGNAYDAAKVYFDEFGKKLDAYQKTFDSLRSCYEQAAQEVFQLAEVLKTGVALLADMAIIWMANMATATAVNAVPVGGQVASVAMFALAASQAVWMIGKFAVLVEACDATMLAITALGAITATAIDGFSAADGFPEAGSTAYDNKVVR